MRETKEHSIDGYTYHVSQLGAKIGKNVLAHIMRVIGPAFEAADPVAKFANALSDAELDYLCDVFSKNTQVAKDEEPGKVVPLADQFDLHFAGRYGALLKWLWACIETNYSGFLVELGLTEEVRAQLVEEFKKELTKVQTPSSPTTSSGASSLRASAP